MLYTSRNPWLQVSSMSLSKFSAQHGLLLRLSCWCYLILILISVINWYEFYSLYIMTWCWSLCEVLILAEPVAKPVLATEHQPQRVPWGLGIACDVVWTCTWIEEGHVASTGFGWDGEAGAGYGWIWVNSWVGNSGWSGWVAKLKPRLDVSWYHLCLYLLFETHFM